MKLLELVNTYVTLKRSLGMRFATQPRVLRRFARVIGDVDICEVTPDAVRAFLDGNKALTNTWFLNYRLLRGLFTFAISRGFVRCSPLPDLTPSPLPAFRPHIYSTSEISALLSATSVLKSCRNPLQPFTFRVLLLTLYSTGMRVGEALRLSLRDADLHDRVFTVRDTKFFKSRLVPLGPRVTSELVAFQKRRCTLPTPHLDDSAFFASSTGEAIPYQHVITLFQRVRSAAGLRRDDGSSYPPRLHDLRHTAAVHRVIAWYRDGADVQRLLPQLATYLGHKDLRGTQHYLSMTPELLEQAGLRFEDYADVEGHHA
jgi:site-specific recombinase XerD